MPTNDSGFLHNPDAAALSYEKLLKSHGLGEVTPFFDLHLLGMGEEGHINSLFPHTSAVREKNHNVVAVTDSPKPPTERITLTLPAVNQSRQVWLLVTGKAKAYAVSSCLSGARAEDFPAAGTSGQQGTIWFIDDDAASTLT